jgi:hypothetical protein
MTYTVKNPVLIQLALRVGKVIDLLHIHGWLGLNPQIGRPLSRIVVPLVFFFFLHCKILKTFSGPICPIFFLLLRS